MALVKDGAVVEGDLWEVVLEEGAAWPESGPVVAPLARLGAVIERAQGERGVWLEPGDDVHALAEVVGDLDAIFIAFPKFADGRGYSMARLLRDRLGYTGELRAVGDVLRDQLFYLKRCGFDAFEIALGHDVEAAIKGFSDFTVTYQADAEGRVPIYRRGEDA